MIGNIRAKKSLGQNFLKEPFYLERIADVAQIGPDDRVLEIGPGLGHLTRVLLQRARKVLAVEVDDRLVDALRSSLGTASNFELLHADALEFDYASLDGEWKVVANLPYYISTPIIQRLIRNCRKFRLLTLMLQKEVAERIAALPGNREYGYLSVLVQCYAVPRMEFSVPSGSFTPRPKVDSAVVTLMVRDDPSLRPDREEVFFRVVKAAFSQRRKTLRNALRQLDVPRERMDGVLGETGIDLGRRAETLSIADFGKLADFLFS